ncbi:MAG: hypothetical protein J3K34DRAFT_394385 [Monoraphidium minutum]|nr:MAG: hypothetical protein J3K34DRAFT_394385 [Monoraphidium minutum]
MVAAEDGGAPAAENRTLFFARAPHSTTENDVKLLFSAFGRVEAVKCFRAGAAAAGGPAAAAAAGLGTKGCGLVKMSNAREAAAAIAALHEAFTWSGMPSPMIVRWMEPDGQHRRRAAQAGRASTRGGAARSWATHARAAPAPGEAGSVAMNILRALMEPDGAPPPPQPQPRPPQQCQQPPPPPRAAAAAPPPPPARRSFEQQLNGFRAGGGGPGSVGGSSTCSSSSGGGSSGPLSEVSTPPGAPLGPCGLGGGLAAWGAHERALSAAPAPALAALLPAAAPAPALCAAAYPAAAPLLQQQQCFGGEGPYALMLGPAQHGPQLPTVFGASTAAAALLASAAPPAPPLPAPLGALSQAGCGAAAAGPLQWGGALGGCFAPTQYAAPAAATPLLQLAPLQHAEPALAPASAPQLFLADAVWGAPGDVGSTYLLTTAPGALQHVL